MPSCELANELAHQPDGVPHTMGNFPSELPSPLTAGTPCQVRPHHYPHCPFKFAEQQRHRFTAPVGLTTKAGLSIESTTTTTLSHTTHNVVRYGRTTHEK